MGTFRKGDKVSWNTAQGKTHGTVTRKVTSNTQLSGHNAKASVADPQHEVKSSSTGKKAIHKPESLNRE